MSVIVARQSADPSGTAISGSSGFSLVLAYRKTKRPPTNKTFERFNRTVLNEFYRVAFRKKLYSSLEELQADLDAWLKLYNEERSHQGRWCYGKTPMQTFVDSVPLAKEKMIAA